MTISTSWVFRPQTESAIAREHPSTAQPIAVTNEPNSARGSMPPNRLVERRQRQQAGDQTEHGDEPDAELAQHDLCVREIRCQHVVERAPGLVEANGPGRGGGSSQQHQAQLDGDDREEESLAEPRQCLNRYARRGLRRPAAPREIIPTKTRPTKKARSA